MTAKRFIPPAFTSAKARAAQRLAVRSRRATDLRLREHLIDALPAMSRQLRQRVVAGLRQRLVDALAREVRS
jgi:hypothetical protein